MDAEAASNIDKEVKESEALTEILDKINYAVGKLIYTHGYTFATNDLIKASFDLKIHILEKLITAYEASKDTIEVVTTDPDLVLRLAEHQLSLEEAKKELSDFLETGKVKDLK
jgi:hypothetical protein